MSFRLMRVVSVMLAFARTGVGQSLRQAHSGLAADVVGIVQTHAGQPISLALVTVTLDGEEGPAGRGWHDQVLRTNPQGNFHLRVPGERDYRVCVSVPAKGEHCQYATVHGADLATLHFVF